MFHLYTILDLGGHAWPKQDISCFIYSFQYQAMWIACTCFIMWGLSSTGTITRFLLKRISSWMLSSCLKSKYLPIADGTSSLVSGQPILMICLNCWRPSSSSDFFFQDQQAVHSWLVKIRPCWFLQWILLDTLQAWLLTPPTTTLLHSAYWEGMFHWVYQQWIVPFLACALYSSYTSRAVITFFGAFWGLEAVISWKCSLAACDLSVL